MNDPFSVRGIERVGNLNRQTEQGIWLDRFSGDAVLQRQAVQKFHGNERVPTLLTDVMDHANVRMIQR
jgi:hypothetical protein